MARPDLFLVGGAKCGTTAMFEHLRAHPDIAMATMKEPCHFADDLPWEPNDTRVAGRAEYLALFDHVGDARRVGEGSPAHLLSETAAGNIAKFNPDARIVVMVRHPVDTMASLHRYLLALGLEHEPDFEAALALEPARRAGVEQPRRRHMMRRWLHYTEVADHAAGIERYLAVFDRQQVHVVVRDDLLTDAGATWRRLLEFLEVDPTVPYPDTQVNAAIEVRSAALRDLLMDTPKAVSRLWRRVPAPVRRTVRGAARQAVTRPAGATEVDGALRARLVAEWSTRIDTLGDLIERDLSAWKT